MRSRSDARLHPCFDCTLPDCDDGSPACALRRAQNTYYNMRRRGETITDDVRQRYNIAFAELYGNDRNAKRRGSRQVPA